MGWYDDGSEEEYQMERARKAREFADKQEKRKAAEAALVAEYGPRQK